MQSGVEKTNTLELTGDVETKGITGDAGDR